ncbi:MAG: hypothetical protein L0K74_09795 [Acidipropionibacterium acidipropionici]|nr:hypothetical protein [Acidipropionibacterium acidipropionici]
MARDPEQYVKFVAERGAPLPRFGRERRRHGALDGARHRLRTRQRDLLRRWAATMRRGSWLAFQVPGHFDAPSHRLMRETAADGREYLTALPFRRIFVVAHKP